MLIVHFFCITRFLIAVILILSYRELPRKLLLLIEYNKGKRGREKGTRKEGIRKD